MPWPPSIKPWAKPALPISLPLAGTVASGLAGALLAVAQAALLSRVVAAVFLQGAGLSAQVPALVGLGGVILGRALAALASEVASARAGSAVRLRLRRALYQTLLDLGPAYTRQERTGELVSVAYEGVDALEAYFSQYLPQLALAALAPLAILAFIFPRDLLSGAILLAAAPLLPLFLYLIGTLSDSLTRRQFSALSRLSAHFLDTLQGLTTLKELGRSRQSGQAVAQNAERYRQVTLEVLRVSFISALALELVGTLSTAILAVEISLRLLAGKLGFETALFILVVAPEFFLPLRALGLRFHTGSAGLAAARRLAEILAGNSPATPPSPSPLDLVARIGEQPQPASPGRFTTTAAIPTPARGVSLCFERVTYTYPGSETPALKDVSFQIEPGEQVVLAGRSGAGKSTLLQLILGFIRPEGGRITLDGVDLSGLSPAGWRRLVAWVPQDPYLFNSSLLENLRLGRLGCPPAQAEAAARQAGLQAFIAALPQGLQTPIGERGQRLSSGEAQRLALGRAFLKDAPLLLLDEPAAHLDPALAASLRPAVAALALGRTVLTVAHHPGLLLDAARVLVLEDGCLVQDGDPRALAARPGAFRHLLDAPEVDR